MDHSHHMASQAVQATSDATSYFMPHGHCYLWTPSLVWINASTDGLIFLSYLAISLMLTITVIRVKEIPFQKIYLAFGLFIVACGVGHLMDLLNIWEAHYYATAAVKLITATASVGTALALPFYLPRIKELAQGAVLVRTQKALDESERRYQQLIETTTDGVLMINAQGVIEYANAQLQKLLQYSSDELFGRVVWDFIDVEERPYVEKQVARLKDQQQLQELKFRRKDGQSVWFLAVVSKVKNENKETTGLLGFFTDVTERRREDEQRSKVLADNIVELKKTEQDLIAAREQAIAATKVKSDFLANMSHEIRTPLNGIIGITGLLIDSGLNPTQEEYANIVRRSGDALLHIINDILDFSKIEAGKLDLSLTEFSIEDLVRSSMELFHARVVDRKIDLSAELDDAIPRWIGGDAVRLGQILLNLIGNAIKFTEHGFVKIKIQYDGQEGCKTRLRFSVQDSGIGISFEEQARLFKPFTQADESTARSFGGTGLGLSICKRLVEMMGGSIGIHSEKGCGSTFWFTVLVSEAKAQVHHHEIEPALELPKNHVSGQKMRVLIAEDNPINQVVTVALLKGAGYETVVVANGREVVDEYQRNPYALILMDCQMPEMDGFEATNRIRDLEKNSGTRIPILALTANAMKSDEEKCRQHGMDDFLTKPIKKEPLIKAVQRWLKAG